MSYSDKNRRIKMSYSDKNRSKRVKLGKEEFPTILFVAIGDSGLIANAGETKLYNWIKDDNQLDDGADIEVAEYALVKTYRIKEDRTIVRVEPRAKKTAER